VVREQAGWERVYRLRAAANPGSAAHVLVLVTPSEADFAPAFPSDSALLAARLDSIARVRRADSVAEAARVTRAARAESLAVARRDTTRQRPRSPALADSASRRASPPATAAPGAQEP
jgi:hypothetical protein